MSGVLKFIDNIACAIDGGGIYNDWHSSPVLLNCRFRGNETNWTGSGGAVCNSYYSNPTLTRCTFTENSTYVYGGGVYNYSYCYPVFTNCTFSENSAYEGGGGLYLGAGSDAALINYTIYSNTVGLEIGGGIYNYNSAPAITNCILWSNSLDPFHNDNSNPAMTYTCIQGGYSGEGNIDADPLRNRIAQYAENRRHAIHDFIATKASALAFIVDSQFPEAEIPIRIISLHLSAGGKGNTHVLSRSHG